MLFQIRNGFGVAFCGVRLGFGLLLTKDADDDVFLGDINAAVVFVAHQETFLAFGCSFQLFGCVDDGCPLVDCKSDVVIQGEGLSRAACLVDIVYRINIQGEGDSNCKHALGAVDNSTNEPLSLWDKHCSRSERGVGVRAAIN